MLLSSQTLFDDSGKESYTDIDLGDSSDSESVLEYVIEELLLLSEDLPAEKFLLHSPFINTKKQKFLQ